jgi:hypothetical protein
MLRHLIVYSIKYEGTVIVRVLNVNMTASRGAANYMPSLLEVWMLVWVVVSFTFVRARHAVLPLI